MEIKEILEKLQNILDEDIMNESPITLTNSGDNLFDKPMDMDTIVDKCLEIYNTNPKSKGYAELLDKHLIGILPFNSQHTDKKIVIVYGTEYFGVRHILSRHGEEYNNKRGESLSFGQVERALRELPNALDSGKFLISFDLKNVDSKINYKTSKNKQPIPQTDRVILEHQINGDIYYFVILIAGFAGTTDVTCPLTVFKPTDNYRKRIEKLNSIHRIL